MDFTHPTTALIAVYKPLTYGSVTGSVRRKHIRHMVGNARRTCYYAATKSTFSHVPVALAIFSSVLRVMPSYSPLSMRDTACWLVSTNLANCCWVRGFSLG